jgi:two-component system, OmpR family, KDP operon response regulator KdpE
MGDDRVMSDARARMTRILVVEDHAELQRALRINLRARLYDVIAARTGQEALALAANRPPDAVILDLGLPDIGGTEVIVELRRWYLPPIIVLSGRTSPGDKIGALDAGADDYVTKPFEMGELLARLRAALRRDEGHVTHGEPHRVVIGRWQVDLASYRITSVDAAAAPSGSVETLRLTPTEWAILKLLVQRPGQLVSSAQLLTSVWGPGYQDRTNYLRFHVARLRHKLEDNPTRPRHLLTEPGMGYRYQPEVRPMRASSQTAESRAGLSPVEARLAEREPRQLGPLARQERQAAGRGIGRGRAFDPGGQHRRVRLLDDGHAENAAQGLPGEAGVAGVRQPDAQDARAHR